MSESKVKQGLNTIKKAIVIRAEISELYKQYGALTHAAVLAGGLAHHDLKRAVDALYYFGGGWPHENSKGRMEALLDNFVGMYRILDFIGEGAKVTDHLAKYGVSVKIDPLYAITNVELTSNDVLALNGVYNLRALGVTDPKDLADLLFQVISACMDLQREICAKADMIKDNLRPAAQNALGVEDEEYDRLHGLMKITTQKSAKAPEKLTGAKIRINQSVSKYNSATALIA